MSKISVNYIYKNCATKINKIFSWITWDCLPHQLRSCKPNCNKSGICYYLKKEFLKQLYLDQVLKSVQYLLNLLSILEFKTTTGNIKSAKTFYTNYKVQACQCLAPKLIHHPPNTCWMSNNKNICIWNQWLLWKSLYISS